MKMFDRVMGRYESAITKLAIARDRLTDCKADLADSEAALESARGEVDTLEVQLDEALVEISRLQKAVRPNDEIEELKARVHELSLGKHVEVECQYLDGYVAKLPLKSIRSANGYTKIHVIAPPR